MARPWYRRRGVLLSSAAIVVCLVLCWLNPLWREYSGNKRLQAAIAVANSDMPEWQTFAERPFQNDEKLTPVFSLQLMLRECKQLDTKELALWKKQYLTEAERASFLSFARSTRAWLNQHFEELQFFEKARERYYSNPGFFSLYAPKTRIGWLDQKLFPIWKKYLFFPSDRDWPGVRATVLMVYNEFVEIAKLPEREWILAIERKANPVGEHLFAMSWLDQFGCAGFWMSMRESIIKYTLEYRSLVRCAAVACAAEEFRIKNERWPNNCEELVPKYLSCVPIDGFTQKPLLWKELSDGLVIYSVGRDGKDNGGDVMGSEEGPAKDVGIRLWDANHRGKETITKKKTLPAAPQMQTVWYPTFCTLGARRND